jgi:hypothetical protein
VGVLRAVQLCVAALHSPEQCLPLAHGFGECLGLHGAHAKSGGVHELGGTALVARDDHDAGHFVPGHMVTVEQES